MLLDLDFLQIIFLSSLVLLLCGSLRIVFIVISILALTTVIILLAVLLCIFLLLLLLLLLHHVGHRSLVHLLLIYLIAIVCLLILVRILLRASGHFVSVFFQKQGDRSGEQLEGDEILLVRLAASFEQFGQLLVRRVNLHVCKEGLQTLRIDERFTH